MATIGMVLTLGGASAAALALRLLRGDSCPGCGTVGSLAILWLVPDAPVGFAPSIIRFRQCRDCGTAVQDRLPADRVSAPARLVALARERVP